MKASLLHTCPANGIQCCKGGRRVRRSAWCLRAKSGNKSSEYAYNSGDGKQKVTIEHVFQGESSLAPGEGPAPWTMSWQMNERNLVWSDDLKTRLVKRIGAEELDIPEDQFEEQLFTLSGLLPGVTTRLANMPPKLLARLVSNVDDIAYRLVKLKELFPLADVPKLALGYPALLLDFSVAQIEENAKRLSAILPDLKVDFLVEKNPIVLDIESFEEAIRDANRMMGNVDIQHLMAQDPDLILSLQKGSSMIPYDEVPGAKH